MRKSWLWLGLIVLLVFSIRMFFALKTPFLSSDDSYLHLRVVDSLRAGDALFHDPLGYGGRSLVFSPLFDLLAAVLTFFLPVGLAVKVLPNFAASLLAVPAFLIAYELTKHNVLSLSTSFLVSIVPVFFANTFNHLTPLSVALPLFFFLLYEWIHLKRVYVFLAGLLFFVFFHPLSIVFIICLAVYFFLSFLDGVRVSEGEYEIGLFAIFFALWAQFLLYKRVILFHGPAVIWQNIPTGLLSSFYANVSLLEAIVQVGAYPLAEGIYALYRTALRHPQRELNVLLSVTIVSGALLWFKLIALETGLMLLGITLGLLFAKWSIMFLHFGQLTKFSRFAPLVVGVSVVLALVTTGIPAYAAVQSELRETISQEDVSVLQGLSRTSSSDAVVLAPVEYGNYVTYFARRKNVVDGYFLMQPRINERFEDVERVFKTQFQTEAVELFDKYNATYLVVPPGVSDVKFAGRCFERVHATNVKVYIKNPECKVRVVA
ncbi:hypothetical protein HY489_02055 [Candidatus Woesearchaeota archaeon]|nr:hypothetical protein [Candidatus Woesearchaeota archaeon]